MEAAAEAPVELMRSYPVGGAVVAVRRGVADVPTLVAGRHGADRILVQGGVTVGEGHVGAIVVTQADPDFTDIKVPCTRYVNGPSARRGRVVRASVGEHHGS